MLNNLQNFLDYKFIPECSNKLELSLNDSTLKILNHNLFNDLNSEIYGNLMPQLNKEM